MSAKRKLPARLGQPAIKPSAKLLPKVNLDESKAAVFSGGNARNPNANNVKEIVNISSDSSSAGGEHEEDSDEEIAEQKDAARATSAEDGGGGDVTMEDAGVDDAEEEEAGEPSFGELVRANAGSIDVAAAFADPSSQPLAASQRNQIQPPSGASLGIVLAQALKTNDVATLETCLHTTDVNTIRATIQRLDSPLAATLLSKLAERLHRRPGRAGSLMVWVQWTLVTHGGYLATQPDLIRKLADLTRVIDERSKSLQSLLSLKGKLDMLEAQITLRRNMQEQQQRVDEEDDDSGVIYVEGQESEDEEVGQELVLNGDMSDLESEMSEDMPTTNGFVAESDDSEADSDEDYLIDDEAEESEDDEDEVDHDDQDSEEADDDSDGEIQTLRPSKMQKLSGSTK